MSALDPEVAAALLAPLAALDARLVRDYPGGVPVQPAHTCYVPADRMREQEARRWGDEALALLAAHAPDEDALSQALDRPLAAGTYDDVLRILASAPVADLRVDLEDGYGLRPDAEEDRHVAAAVVALASGAPQSYGLRVKPFETATARRSLRTLQVWLESCAEQALPPGIVTLAKIQDPVQVAAAVDVVEALEAAIGAGRMAIEVQIETAAAVVGSDGRVTVPALLAAGRGRVTGLHFGTYDFTAAIGLAPQEQASDAPPADAAKDLIQLAAAARGVAVSDGSSNRLPVGGRDTVHAAWAEHGRLVDRAMRRGLWQGWDLHPGQLVSRWSTVVSFLRHRLPEVEQRLAGTREDVADEPATVSMLRAFRRRAEALGIASTER